MAEVNRVTLAEILGVSMVTLDNYKKKGMPCIKPGRHGKEYRYDTKDVIKWLIQEKKKNGSGDMGTLDLTELKARKLAAETTKAEVEAAIVRDEVIKIDDAVKLYTDSVFRCKARLFQVPLRVAPQIVGETDETRIKEIIKQEIYSCCDELSTEFTEFEDDSASEAEEEQFDSVGAAS